MRTATQLVLKHGVDLLKGKPVITKVVEFLKEIFPVDSFKGFLNFTEEVDLGLDGFDLVFHLVLIVPAHSFNLAYIAAMSTFIFSTGPKSCRNP
jgi:hypothetical protein